MPILLVCAYMCVFVVCVYQCVYVWVSVGMRVRMLHILQSCVTTTLYIELCFCYYSTHPFFTLVCIATGGLVSAAKGRC